MTAALPKQAKIADPLPTETAALPIATAPSETRILLEGVSWETYERLLAETGESRNQRFAYDSGILEVMVPLPTMKSRRGCLMILWRSLSMR